MTRRVRTGPIQGVASGMSRMAPGGRKSAAESPVRRLSRLVGAAGIESEPEPEPELPTGEFWMATYGAMAPFSESDHDPSR